MEMLIPSDYFHKTPDLIDWTKREKPVAKLPRNILPSLAKGKLREKEKKKNPKKKGLSISWCHLDLHSYTS